jgi:hypothetical protein
MTILLTMALAISFSTKFEGGNLGPVETVGPLHYRCPVSGEADHQRRNRQASWYYFRIDGARGQALILDLTNLLGEYNYNAGVHAVTANTRPVYSHDNRTWHHFTSNEVTWDDARKELRLKLTPRGDRIWIAHMPPYTNETWARFRKESPGIAQEEIGRTVGGRPLELLTIGNGPRVIWILARQHSWEAGTSWMLEGGLRWLLSRDPAAANLRTEFTWKVIPMGDPDGVARGGVRYNAHGFDLNRNWDTVDPAKMPEIAATRAAIFKWLDSAKPVHLFITLHNTENHDYVDAPPDFAPLAERMYNALKQRTSFWSKFPGPRKTAPTTTAGMKGRMSVVQGLYADRQVPGMLLETSVEPVPTLQRPRTVTDWQEFGRGLIASLAEAAR